jgi:hypothetical protein
MYGKTPGTSSVHDAGEKVVRTYRIRIENIPALFSEGLATEPVSPKGRSWMQIIGARLAQPLANAASSLMPAQARNEKAVGAAAMRRQTHAQA